MLTVSASTSNCFSKDARSNAPSVNCAHNSDNMNNVAIISGIAAAVSVFLFALISMICCIICCIIAYGIIIRSIPAIIISAIMIFCIINIIMIMRFKENLNSKAKLCYTQG